MGLRAVVSSGNFDVMWHQAGILSIYACVSILLTLAYFLWNGRRPKKEAEVAESGQPLTV
jgi:putative membrane protein